MFQRLQESSNDNLKDENDYERLLCHETIDSISETSESESESQDKSINKKKFRMTYYRGDSNFYDEKQEDRIFAVREKASELKLKIENNPTLQDVAKKNTEKELEKIRKEWPALFGAEPLKIYVHVDLDSFYAAVETLANPKLKNVPLGVGSELMLAACNYKAREYGVRSGMPGYRARELCPMIVITKVNFQLYNYYSEMVMEILSSYDNEIEIYGIDEACLIFDCEKLKRRYEYFNKNSTNGKSARDISNNNDSGLNEELVYKDFSFESVNELILRIRKRVQRNTGLTISAGISVCRGLAKLSSKINKPDGQFKLEKDFQNFIADLEVDELNGIGKSTKELLFRLLNVKYIKELTEKVYICSLVFRPKSFINLLRLSLGLSFFDYKNENTGKFGKIRSHGFEISVQPINIYSESLFYLWNLSDQLEKRLLKSNEAGNIVTIRLKYIDFNMITKRRKFNELVKEKVQIFEIAVDLLKQTMRKVSDFNGYELEKPIRMVGISISGLVNLKNTKLLEKYFEKDNLYNKRECIICKKSFINEPQIIYEMHVNSCIDMSIKKEPTTLEKYFKFKST